jgi:gliding motility-associated lipoprotein GldD
MSCRHDDPFPKPKSFLRVEFPAHEYEKLEDSCNYAFEVSTIAKVLNKPSSGEQACFKNIIYPQYKASLYCTYVALDSNLFEYTEYSRKLAYEHTIKASGIQELNLVNKDNNVYGTSFEIKGDVACNYLFYLTDSTSNYFAGSLYFETVPNYDSLQPVLDYVVEDIEHMINTFEWK